MTQRYVRHKPRPALMPTDERTFLVLEESPSFYVVYSNGEGLALKAKAHYEETST